MFEVMPSQSGVLPLMRSGRDKWCATHCASPLSHHCFRGANRVIVVGAGKAGAAMAEAVEEALGDLLERVQGLVSVPAESVRPLHSIRLYAARVAGSNHPTQEGVVAAEQILRLVETAGPEDVVLCLLSGGGLALLPAPVSGIDLTDKQRVTELLHKCGATINEMNAVRKHLSRIKGGRLAQVFHGKALLSLIISDVVGDPLDVIASGPTVADSTTFADAVAVLNRYGLTNAVPTAVVTHLQRGAQSLVPETPKCLPANITNRILANNARALTAASAKAKQLGYGVLNLGAFIEGETRQVAVAMSGIVRSICHDKHPLGPPACLLSGGETTVTLAANPHGSQGAAGLGGRNQEFVLALSATVG